MDDLLLIGVLLMIVSASAIYIIRARKRGVKCIGCPAAGECSKKNKNGGNCSCGCSEKVKN